MTEHCRNIRTSYDRIYFAYCVGMCFIALLMIGRAAKKGLLFPLPKPKHLPPSTRNASTPRTCHHRLSYPFKTAAYPTVVATGLVIAVILLRSVCCPYAYRTLK